MTSKVGDRTAEHAWNKSCYSGIDYTISDDATVYDMVEKLVAHDVGCLVTKDAEGKISGGVQGARELISYVTHKLTSLLLFCCAHNI